MCERHYHDHRRNLVDNISAGGAKTPQQIEREKKKEREERAKEVSDSDNEDRIDELGFAGSLVLCHFAPATMKSESMSWDSLGV